MSSMYAERARICVPILRLRLPWLICLDVVCLAAHIVLFHMGGGYVGRDFYLGVRQRSRGLLVSGHIIELVSVPPEDRLVQGCIMRVF